VKAIVYRHMSHLTERTPLLPNNTQDGSTTSRSSLREGQHESNIALEAHLISASLRNNQDAVLDLPSSKPECLVILLYASHTLSGYIRDTVVPEEERLVSNLAVQDSLEERIRKRLDEEIERILDSWSQSLDGDGVDDRFLYEALWKTWDIGDGSRSSGKPFIVPIWARMRLNRKRWT
jgi:hypothetical protein